MELVWAYVVLTEAATADHQPQENVVGIFRQRQQLYSEGKCSGSHRPIQLLILGPIE